MVQVALLVHVDRDRIRRADPDHVLRGAAAGLAQLDLRDLEVHLVGELFLEFVAVEGLQVALDGHGHHGQGGAAFGFATTGFGSASLIKMC